MFASIKKNFEKDIYYEATAEQVLANTNNKFKEFYDKLDHLTLGQLAFRLFRSERNDNIFVVICNLYDKDKDIIDKKKFIEVSFENFKEILLNKCKDKFVISFERYVLYVYYVFTPYNNIQNG